MSLKKNIAFMEIAFDFSQARQSCAAKHAFWH